MITFTNPVIYLKRPGCEIGLQRATDKIVSVNHPYFFASADIGECRLERSAGTKPCLWLGRACIDLLDSIEVTRVCEHLGIADPSAARSAP